MNEPTIHAINIKLPFWLRWAKRFIKLEHYKIEQKAKIVGQSFDTIIVDELITTQQEIYVKKILATSTPKRKENIGKFT